MNPWHHPKMDDAQGVAAPAAWAEGWATGAQVLGPSGTGAQITALVGSTAVLVELKVYVPLTPLGEGSTYARDGHRPWDQKWGAAVIKI